MATIIIDVLFFPVQFQDHDKVKEKNKREKREKEKKLIVDEVSFKVQTKNWFIIAVLLSN